MKWGAPWAAAIKVLVWFSSLVNILSYLLFGEKFLNKAPHRVLAE